MNQVQAIGRLTRDPQTRKAADQDVCQLRVAVPRRKRDDGAIFIDVSCFGRQAQACSEHLRKGSRIAYSGRLEYQEWEAKDGTKRSRHEVIADRVEFLDPAPANGTKRTQQGSTADVGDDDLSS